MDLNRLKIPAHSPNAGKAKTFFQPKLAINKPGDVYEQEADAMAEKVMRMTDPAPAFFGKPAIPVQRKCSACEDEEQLQLKEAPSSIQKEDDEQEEGVAFKPFLPGVTGHWPSFGFNVDVSNLQLDFGSLMNRQLSLGLNFPGEPYAAISGKEDRKSTR